MQLDAPPSHLAIIADGRKGTQQTLEMMKRFVRMGKRSPNVREAALSLIQSLPSKDWLNEIKVLHQYVRDNVRYTKDILGVETLQTADRTLDLGQGDCDDKAVLLASLLESIGVPTRFKAVGFQPGILSHVYVQAKLGNGWVSAEATENVPLGWEPRNIQSVLIVTNRG